MPGTHPAAIGEAERKDVLGRRDHVLSAVEDLGFRLATDPVSRPGRGNHGIGAPGRLERTMHGRGRAILDKRAVAPDLTTDAKL